MIGMAGCTAASSGDDTSSDTQTNTAAASESAADDTSASPDNSDVITAEEAKETALSHAQLTEEEVTFLRTELDMDDGRKIYEIEFYSGDTEYDYDIDASTGDIISYDHDVENYTGQADGTSEIQEEYIGEEKAKSIALEKVPGATEEHIQLQLDYDDGKAVYEGSIIFEQSKYEFEIDAVSGAIINWELDD